MSLFSITLTPRISETDLVGHVNNVSIAAWFEDLRVRYMDSLLDSWTHLHHHWICRRSSGPSQPFCSSLHKPDCIKSCKFVDKKSPDYRNFWYRIHI